MVRNSVLFGSWRWVENFRCIQRLLGYMSRVERMVCSVNFVKTSHMNKITPKMSTNSNYKKFNEPLTKSSKYPIKLISYWWGNLCKLQHFYYNIFSHSHNPWKITQSLKIVFCQNTYTLQKRPTFHLLVVLFYN